MHHHVVVSQVVELRWVRKEETHQPQLLLGEREKERNASLTMGVTMQPAPERIWTE